MRRRDPQAKEDGFHLLQPPRRRAGGLDPLERRVAAPSRVTRLCKSGWMEGSLMMLTEVFGGVCGWA
jgi:predicted Zn-ribbon and HTH transcriptional regulator